MKKIVSLLLAGVMGLTMASAVAAKPATTSIAQNDWNYIRNTLAGGSDYYYGYPYFGVTGPNYMVSVDDDFYPLNSYYWWWYLSQQEEDKKDDATTTPDPAPDLDNVDDEMFVSYDDKWNYVGASTCPTKGCNIQCNTYVIPNLSKWNLYAYCPEHGTQSLSSSANITYPSVSVKTYSVIGYNSLGGSVLINGLNSNATVPYGGSVSVSVVPNDGYELSYVTVNGTSIGANSSFTLDNIRGNYYISAYFTKIPVNVPFTVTAKATGNGSVYAIVDGKSVGTIGSVTGYYKNAVELRFVPGKGNYKVGNVTINGISMGSITNFTMDHFRSNLAVDVTFVWDNPYSDVKTHLAAVEYVTENGIMGSPNQYLNTDKFQGESGVTVKALACYLAEMADVSGKLGTVTDRIAWAKDKGLIAADEKLDTAASLHRTCDMLEVFLRGLEKDNKIVYTALKNADSAYEIADAMDLVNETVYAKNGNISRYDMAEICYAISNLDAVVAK